MTRKRAVFCVALCAIWACGIACGGSRAQGTESGPDHPGDWKLDFKNAGDRHFRSIQFVRLLRPRDARGEVKYDVIVMTDNPHYPFGLWDTYLGRCESHATADIWMGEIDAEGDAKGAPSIRTEFEPEIKRTTGYETLEKVCTGADMPTVPDPVAYARDFLKR